MQHNLVIYGTAIVTEGGAAELLRRLGHVYTGREFPLPEDPPPGYVVRCGWIGSRASTPGTPDEAVTASEVEPLMAAGLWVEAPEQGPLRPPRLDMPSVAVHSCQGRGWRSRRSERSTTAAGGCSPVFGRSRSQPR